MNLKFALLTTNNHPLIDGYLSAMEKNKVERFGVFLDSKNLSDENIDLIKSRIGNWDLANKYGYSRYKQGYKIPFFHIESHNSPQIINLIKDYNLEFLVNAGTPRKISPEIIKLLPKGILNVHPGNLPKYRGQDSPEWALFNNDPIEVTAHLMGAEYDNGPIILSKIVKTDFLETYQYFRRNIYENIFEVTALASNYLLSIDKANLPKGINENYKLHSAMPKYILKKLIKNNFKSDK